MQTTKLPVERKPTAPAGTLTLICGETQSVEMEIMSQMLLDFCQNRFQHNQLYFGKSETFDAVRTLVLQAKGQGASMFFSPFCSDAVQELAIELAVSEKVWLGVATGNSTVSVVIKDFASVQPPDLKRSDEPSSNMPSQLEAQEVEYI